MMWYAILAVLVAGYLVLGGIDYGIGLAGRDPALVRPFFLGNQVWVVAALGVIVGAFPHADEVLLAEHHLIVGVVGAGLACVMAGLLLGFIAPGWDWVHRVGSVAVSGGLGAYLGQLATGGAVLGGVLGALAMVALLTCHGIAFAERRWWLLALTSGLLAAAAPGVALVAPELELAQADSATLSVLAWVVVPLMPVLLGVQALWWWLVTRSRSGSRRSSA